GAIQRAQNSIESRNAEIRKNVLKYDDVLTKQRKKFYEERGRILEGEELEPHIERFMDEVSGGTVDAHTRGKPAEDVDLEELWGALRPAYPVSLTAQELSEEVGGKEHLEASVLKEEILADARVAYEKRREALGEEGLQQLQRRVLLALLGLDWPAAGASTSTRWTISRRASVCARWRSVTRSSSTSARATSCSTT